MVLRGPIISSNLSDSEQMPRLGRRSLTGGPGHLVLTVASPYHRGWSRTMLSTILIVLLVLFLIGALPTWPHSANWGYGPSGGLGLVLLVLLILLLTGRL